MGEVKEELVVATVDVDFSFLGEPLKPDEEVEGEFCDR